MSGRYGKFVSVDLASGRIKDMQVEEEDLKRYFGGGGIGAKLFIDGGDEDAVVIANGLLTGHTVPTACKTSILFRSPLTGIFGESSVGGHWGAQLKRTGIDGLILHGQSPHPVYLLVADNAVEIRDASTLWGLDTLEADRALSEQLAPGAQIGVIGPAGENGVLFASMMVGGDFPRAAGRTGIGCKFGQKKIKAVAFKGSRKPSAHDPKELTAYVRALNRSIRERAATFHQFGTAGAVARREKSGDLPIRNFSLGTWEGAGKISSQVYAQRMHLKHEACFMCPIACAKKIEIRQGPHAGEKMAQPEYETVAALGSNLLNDSPEDIAIQNMLCNRYGLDTISTGVVIGFLFECVDRGVIEKEDPILEGIRPAWGNVQAIGEIIRKIAHREGIGDLLADGVRKAAERLGKGSERFAVHAKGLELPMHDPRALASAAATYATGNRGGSHNESFAHYLDEGLRVEGMGFPDKVDPHASEGKGKITAGMQNINAAFDALGLCKFLMVGGVGLPQLPRFIELAMGWKMSAKEILEAGDRIFTLKRIYNQRWGVGRDTDTVAPRVLEEKRGTGGSAKNLPDLNRMLDELYALRGWDEHGRVTRQRAAQLGLEDYLK